MILECAYQLSIIKLPGFFTIKIRGISEYTLRVFQLVFYRFGWYSKKLKYVSSNN